MTISDARLQVRFALRMMRKTPGLTAVATLCLAVGIGLVTAAFTVVYGAFLAPLPVPGGDRMVMVHEYDRTGSFNVPMTAAQFTNRRHRSTSFDGLGAWFSRNVTLAGADGRTAASVVRAAYVSPNTFDLVGISPLLGRVPAESDLAPGSTPVTVLAHGLWRAQFGSDSAIVGRDIEIGGQPHRVIGVMPDRFAFPVREQIWIPVQMDPSLAGATEERLTVFGRLRTGISSRQAMAELEVLAGPERTRTDVRATTLVMPFTRGYMSPEEESALYGFIGGLMAFLIITAANVANLFLARNSARQREMSLRSALGADRGRLVVEMLVESLVLGVGAALVGLGVARAAVVWFLSMIEDVPWWADFGLSPVVVGFAVFSALLASVVAGVGPAIRLTRTPLIQALGQGGYASTGVRFSRVGAGLLVLQVAVSVGFLSVLGVLAQGLLSFGFQTVRLPGTEILVAQVYLGRPAAAELSQSGSSRQQVWERHFARSLQQFESIRDQLRREAGVRDVTFSSHFPGNDREAVRIEIERGRDDVAGFTTRVAQVGPAFFETLGASMLHGRDFAAGERTGVQRAVVVNEPFARKYFPDESPIGRALRVVEDQGSTRGPWLEIVGVVPDLGLSPGDPSRADGIYLPFPPSNFARLGIRANVEPLHLVPRLHEIVRQTNPAAQVQSTESLATLMLTAARVFHGLGLGLLVIGGSSLLLSAVSFYALVSFGVTRRRRELGIRLALGAPPAHILRAVLGRELAIILTGGVAGLAIGFGLYQLVAQVPFDLRPAGPSLTAAFFGLMLLVGAGACWGPARRALAVDPIETMRE